MPVENERKYILSLKSDQAQNLVDDYSGKAQYISQAYIGSGRVRSIQVHDEDVKYVFTWKTRRPDGSSLEIETDISYDDYEDFIKMADVFISKARVKIKGYGVKWDVDFLFENGKTSDAHYLTIAEVEMPEGMDEPAVLPDFVKDNLLYLVPRDQDRQWTNSKLSDPKHVKKMLEDALKEGK